MVRTYYECKKKTLLKNQDNTPIDIINVKSDTLEENVRQYAESIFPGYHMNHKTWISIILDDSLDDETVMSFVKQSYALTGMNPRCPPGQTR